MIGASFQVTLAISNKSGVQMIAWIAMSVSKPVKNAAIVPTIQRIRFLFVIL